MKTLVASASGQLLRARDAEAHAPENVRLCVNMDEANVVWSTRTVSGDALTVARAHLTAARYRRVTLLIDGGDWLLKERYDHPDSAVSRIAEAAVIFGAANLASLSPYKAMRRELFEDAGTRISGVVAGWARSGGVLNGDFLSGLNRLGLLDRAIILNQDESDRSLRFRFIGEGFAQRYGAGWPRQAIGRADTEEFHDAAYSAWVAGHSRSVATSGEPRRDFIDSIIKNAGHTPKAARVQYDRALLPCRFLSGAPGVLAVSEVKPGLCPLTP